MCFDSSEYIGLLQKGLDAMAALEFATLELDGLGRVDKMVALNDAANLTLSTWGAVFEYVNHNTTDGQTATVELGGSTRPIIVTLEGV